MTPARPAPGLRERKKLKTRSAIRRATYELIARQGYEATTVEQIAAAAEVSPSTVIRYFPAKEDIVLTDDQAEHTEAALLARPADEPVLTSLRHVVKDQLRAADPAEVALRARLLRDVPAVRSRMLDSLASCGRSLATTVATRTGHPETDLSSRVLATAVVGSLIETTLYWAERDCRDDLLGLVDEAFGAFGAFGDGLGTAGLTRRA
ncbi:TetR family transcriptional regulator [Streptomyces sp. B-S-A8]|uniref:TetR family transcriptional regulator n=1 Tax=Streptomyces solicavernae TaxID=3043614 RepID=A0ABT6RYC2_9ACTN|nr:TetR family transcriptional regulator [Streptomyces sp. B-S-A8]MDI3389325.1 TetR family transcriptional regulator [Streptomyces sp. B-S-A8]